MSTSQQAVWGFLDTTFSSTSISSCLTSISTLPSNPSFRQVSHLTSYPAPFFYHFPPCVVQPHVLPLKCFYLAISLFSLPALICTATLKPGTSLKPSTDFFHITCHAASHCYYAFYSPYPGNKIMAVTCFKQETYLVAEKQELFFVLCCSPKIVRLILNNNKKLKKNGINNTCALNINCIY